MTVFRKSRTVTVMSCEETSYATHYTVQLKDIITLRLIIKRITTDKCPCAACWSLPNTQVHMHLLFNVTGFCIHRLLGL